MNSKDLAEFKRKLETLKFALEKEIKDLGGTPDFGSDVDSFEEEAEEAEAVGVNLGIGSVVKERLRRVREALRKIEDGTYGVGERCKNDIERELLNIDLESELCRECKAQTR